MTTPDFSNMSWDDFEKQMAEPPRFVSKLQHDEKYLAYVKKIEWYRKPGGSSLSILVDFVVYTNPELPEQVITGTVQAAAVPVSERTEEVRYNYFWAGDTDSNGVFQGRRDNEAGFENPAANLLRAIGAETMVNKSKGAIELDRGKGRMLIVKIGFEEDQDGTPRARAKRLFRISDVVPQIEMRDAASAAGAVDPGVSF